MPVRIPNTPFIEVLVHRTASDFLTAAWPSLFQRESAANTILPSALRLLAVERATAVDAEACSEPRESPRSSHACVPLKTAPISPRGDCLWLTCWSTPEGGAPGLDIVLSCTANTLGNQPIFIYSSLPPAEVSRAFLKSRVAALVTRLSSLPICLSRVFSVFGYTPLAKEFASQWSAVTGVTQECEPFYAATFTYATKESLTPPNPLPSGDCMRRATLDDIPAVGKLCKEFADGSVHYPLSYERSLHEAEELVRRRQAWVYETYEGQIASVVAVTRTSPNVAAITKVYTTAVWRKRGCAERLVRNVTQELLHTAGKQRVVLYVSHGNPAEKVYDRVGFVGLGSKKRPAGVEDWIEIGFKETCRGHW